MASARVEVLAKEMADMKAAIEAKTKELDGGLGAIKAEVAKLPALEAKSDGVEKRLTEYTESLAINQAKTTEIMMTEVMKMASQMSERDIKIAELQGAIQAITTSGTGGGGAGYAKKDNKEFFDPAKLQIETLQDQANWRKWKTDAEDMLEGSVSGMGELLDKVRLAKAEIDEGFIGNEAMWKRKDRLYRFLRRYTDGESRKVVEGARANNGWESWRRLYHHYEQGMENQKGQARQALANYMTRKANNVQESRLMMSELDRTIKKYAEILGEEPPEEYVRAIIEKILDQDTLRYMVGYQVEGEVGLKAYRERLATFLGTMFFNSGAKSKDQANMDIDNAEEAASGAEAEPAEEPAGDWLGIFQGACWNCGGYGHSQNQCPSAGKGGKGNPKGYGKGKMGKGAPPPPPAKGGKGKDFKGGYGPTKGKGKGKGPCWTCGGPHMARDCPQTQGAGKGYPDTSGGYGKGGIRALHSLVTVMPDDDEVKEWIIPASLEAIITANVDESKEDMKSKDIQKPEDKSEIEPPPVPDIGFSTVISKAARKRARKIIDQGCQDTCCSIGTLETVEEAEEVNAVGGWEEIMIAVDSGATETVIGETQAKTIPTTRSSKPGIKYALANGELVDNEGEKNMVICSIEGVSRSIAAQVTEVNKPLLSVSKMVKAGYTVTFSPEGSHIYDGYTGETMSLEEKNGLFMLRAWAQPSSGFQGLGASP